MEASILRNPYQCDSINSVSRLPKKSYRPYAKPSSCRFRTSVLPLCSERLSSLQAVNRGTIVYKQEKQLWHIRHLNHQAPARRPSKVSYSQLCDIQKEHVRL